MTIAEPATGLHWLRPMTQFVFRSLPDEEFQMLSIEQKLSYLHEAFKALMAQRLGADVADYGFVETSAKQDGRNMTMVLAPHRGAKTRAKAAHDADAPAQQRTPAQPAETPTDTSQKN